MKNKICYNVTKLMKLLPHHQFRRVNYVEEGDECYCKGERLLFVSPDVFSVHIWLGLFGDSMTISLTNGEEIELHSHNVNVNDTTLLRIGKTQYLSPDLIFVNNDWVEASQDLIEWIHKYAVLPDDLSNLDEYLDQISRSYAIEEEITYEGVSSPSKHGGCWGYSSNPLVLRESEIDQVLSGIDDELLREKINCILHARIFKKRG